MLWVHDCCSCICIFHDKKGAVFAFLRRFAAPSSSSLSLSPPSRQHTSHTQPLSAVLAAAAAAARAAATKGHDDPRRYGAQTSNLWSTRVLGVRLLLRGGPAACFALLCCPLLPHTHPFAAARPPQTSRFQCPRPHITSAPLRKGVRSPPRHRESNRHGTVTPRAPRPALRPTAKAACRSAMGRSSGPAYCLFSTLDPGGAAGHSVPQPASLSAALLPSLHAHRAAL
jgi:hypothetical protein